MIKMFFALCGLAIVCALGAEALKSYERVHSPCPCVCPAPATK